jgi:hypothetical protein
VAETNETRPVLVMLAAGMAKRYGGCKPLAPVGLHGEAVIDLTASDALQGGFGSVVLVLGPTTGPAITYHVRHSWPESVDVTIVEQAVPLGTAHAVLCARAAVGDRPFAVVNGDDIYGTDAFALLAEDLATREGQHSLVAFPLQNTIVTDDPVTRGTCVVGPDGHLTAIAERRLVSRQPDGSFIAGDGHDPKHLDGATPVSVNLWGLQPGIWAVLEAAVLAVHPDVDVNGVVIENVKDGGTESVRASSDEVLLPEVVAEMVAGKTPDGIAQPVRVLHGPGRCIGVTHAGDVPVVRGELAMMVGTGVRTERPWQHR